MVPAATAAPPGVPAADPPLLGGDLPPAAPGIPAPTKVPAAAADAPLLGAAGSGSLSRANAPLLGGDGAPARGYCMGETATCVFVCVCERERKLVRV